jgi:aldehyde:ferredoxin oxidoreductase
LAGYKGKLLRVDLSAGTTAVEEVPESERRLLIGGSGLGARIIMEETGPDTDPLGPENRLVFMAGPVTGTPVFCSGRHQVIAKSPLTGIWGEASAGGFFGAMLKRTAFDGIVIQGRAPAPVYLYVENDKVEVRSAQELWGQDTYATEELVCGQTHPGALVSCIGVAGERGTRIAGVMSEGRSGRAAARSGLGAVMGAKNLKAVAVWGDRRPAVANARELAEFNRSLLPTIQEQTKGLSQFGTGAGVERVESIGDLPIKNWKQGTWKDGAKKISGLTMIAEFPTRQYRCHACPIGCGKDVEIAAGEYAGLSGRAPEYESLAALGAYCLVDDLRAVIHANDLCNRYGLDTISAGSTIAFAMELYEHGLLTKADTGGLELTWGSPEVLVTLIHQLARREDLGELLSLGTRAAARRLGGRALEYAIEVKGLEVAAHDPRARSSLALAYATANRGACHLQGQSSIFESFATDPDMGIPQPLDPHTAEGKAELVAKSQAMGSMYDSLCMCRYLRPGIASVVRWTNLVTGWDMDTEEFLVTGSRIYTLKRLYNVRCGISRKDDTLPQRIQTLGFPEAGSKGHLPHLGRMLGEYYRYQGWSEEGLPTRRTLERLGLGKYAYYAPPVSTG